MKHAGAFALDRIESLLRDLRKQEGLKEKARGTFYRNGRAFLHFHEHGEELYVDVRFADAFERLAVSTVKERAFLVGRIRKALADGTGGDRR